MNVSLAASKTPYEPGRLPNSGAVPQTRTMPQTAGASGGVGRDRSRLIPITTSCWPVEGSAGTAAEVLALAEAVSRARHARLLSATNESDGTAALTEAVDSGRSFFVFVRDDVLALEFDEREHLPVVADIVQVLGDAGITPGVVASGREHHVHLFARLPRGPLRAAIDRLRHPAARNQPSSLAL